MEFYKKTSSPIWNYFLSSPETFYEVKGEWSLARVTDIILSKNVHLDHILSSKYYLLSKTASELTQDINEASGFFGYKKYPKTWTENSDEVNQLRDIVSAHISSISQNNYCVYPPKM